MVTFWLPSPACARWGAGSPALEQATGSMAHGCLMKGGYLHSQVAGNYRPLYPKVDHFWFKVAQNREPLPLQVHAWIVKLQTYSRSSGSSCRG